jgi:hypothetical protein
MPFLPRPTGVLRDNQLGLGVELFEQAAAIFKQRLPEPQFDGFAIADPVALKVLADEPEEGFGFLELFVG